VRLRGEIEGESEIERLERREIEREKQRSGERERCREGESGGEVRTRWTHNPGNAGDTISGEAVTREESRS
jgi:hypothetical protein